MKIALIDVKGTDARTIDSNASMNIRNMVILERELDAKFFYNARQLQTVKNDFNVLIFGYGGMSSNIQQVREFVAKNKPDALFWLRTEYEAQTNQSLMYACRDLGMQYTSIQNLEPSGKLPKDCAGQSMLNLNLLIAKPPNQLTQKRFDCVYYSRWRPDRAVYLKKYLQGDIYFSSDAKNFKQHKHIGCNPKLIKKLSWAPHTETLNNFRYSLYMEDLFTHTTFNNLANRWYEAGLCNNVVFFDENCMNTIKKSEIGYFMDEIRNYFVFDYASLQAKIKECNKDFEKHLAIQKQWRMREQFDRSQVINDIKKIIGKKDAFSL